MDKIIHNHDIVSVASLLYYREQGHSPVMPKLVGMLPHTDNHAQVFTLETLNRVWQITNTGTRARKAARFSLYNIIIDWPYTKPYYVPYCLPSSIMAVLVSLWVIIIIIVIKMLKLLDV